MIYETLLIGLVVAVLYVEVMDIYPGGIIVPGYIALFLDQPLRVLATVAIALLSLMTYRLLSRFLFLFGKRRFVLLLLLGTLWSQAWLALSPHFFPDSIELRVIGWLIPGLLANNLEKQRFIPTLASLVTVSILIYFLVPLAGLHR